MRLWALALTITCMAAVVPPSAPAETRLDPVAALRVQLASGTGVTASHVTVTQEPPDKPLIGRSSEVHEVAHGEVVASDIVRQLSSMTRERLVLFPGRFFEQDTDPPPYLPEGKTWLTGEEDFTLALHCGALRLSHPPTIKALLALTKAKRPGGVYDGTRTTLHEGVITLGEAAKVDPDLLVFNRRPKEAEAQIPVRWKLWIGQDHLVRRCQSSYVLLDHIGRGGFEPLQFADDVRMSWWGHAADIRPPAADQVATYDELTFPDAGAPV